MRVEWAETALEDRQRIFEFLYPINPQAAEQADIELMKSIKLLTSNPLLGKAWYGRMRKLLVSQASLLVVYFIERETLKILAVAHQKERFPN